MNAFCHLAYLGPGGPEFLLVMLVLLVLFGAKDAPRIMRRLNDLLSQMRRIGANFKHEVMYGDLIRPVDDAESVPEDSGDSDHDEDYDYAAGNGGGTADGEQPAAGGDGDDRKD